MSFKPIPNLNGTQADFAGSITMSGLTVATQSWVSSQNYLTSETDDQTLDEVLAQGNTSTRDISVANISGSGVFNLKGDTSSQLDISTNTFGAFIHPKGGSYNILYLNSAAGDVRLAQTSVNNKLSLWDNSAQQKVVIASNGNSHFGGGNVGIGTTSPQQKLHVEGTIRIGSDVDLTRYAGQLYTAQNIVLGSLNSETANITVNASATKSVLGVRRPSSGNISILKVRDYSTQDLYVDIDSDGNGYFAGKIGIGTASPSEKLHVIGDSLVSGDSHADSLKPTSSGEPIKFKNFAGTELVRIADSGEVGVGTTSPSHPLEVAGNIKGSSFTIGTDTVYSNDLNITNSGKIRIGNTEFFAKSSNDLSIYSAKLNVTSAGNVGIGTTSPTEELHVVGDLRADRITATSLASWMPDGTISGNTAYLSEIYINNGLHFQSESNVNTIASGSSAAWNSAKNLRFTTQNGGTTWMTLNTDGNVGIGTTSPTEKLHIESGNLLIKPNAVSASHSGLLLGINKYNSGKAGLYGATDGAASNTDGNLYISTRNVSSSNGSYIKLGQRSSTTTSDKGTIVLQAGKYNTNNQTGDILLKYGITDTVTLQGSSGNVGIGTTSPTQTLHVEGSIFIKNNSFIRSKDGGATVYDLLGVTSSGIVQVGQPNRGLKFRGGGASSDIDFELAGSTQFILKGNTGKVGIGTNSPSKKLDVVGDIKSSATVEGVGGVILTSPGGGRFLVTINNSGELQSSSL
jgi:hypothetical protein